MTALRRRALSICLALAAGAAPAYAQADCFDEAAQFHQVNPWILRAIAARESRFNPATVSRNSNGTVDIGMTGTNSVHLPELARYGISQGDLLDGCKASYVAAWRLAKQVRKYGNTWEAVGAYHSETPKYRDRYASLIRQIIEFWAAQGLMR
ncbi:lytic transglycosylase domain-containing protein [Massilia sp. erpn]|nr:lytic transglycosylase domain-containing protein [Massilia sp. erpn]